MIASRSSPCTRSRFLTKNGSGTSSAKNASRSGRGGRQRRAQREVDPLRVPHAQRDHPEGLPGAGPGVLQDQPDDLGDLRRHRRLLARPVILRDDHVPQAVVARHAGERGQRAAVDPVVGERHQALVAAAVVPAQRARRQQRPQRVEHRLEPGSQRHRLVGEVVVVGRVAGVHLAEEVRRRQLPVVARDHHLMGPDHRADRVGGDDLARLVEDHHVEQPGQRQHLADHQRRHRPARLQREQHVAGLVEQPAQRQVAAAQRRLLADHPGLQRVLVDRVPQLPGPRAAHPGAVRGQVLDVASAELLGDLVEGDAVLGVVVEVA